MSIKIDQTDWLTANPTYKSFLSMLLNKSESFLFTSHSSPIRFPTKTFQVLSFNFLKSSATLLEPFVIHIWYKILIIKDQRWYHFFLYWVWYMTLVSANLIFSLTTDGCFTHERSQNFQLQCDRKSEEDILRRIHIATYHVRRDGNMFCPKMESQWYVSYTSVFLWSCHKQIHFQFLLPLLVLYFVISCVM